MTAPSAEAVKRALGGIATSSGYLCRCPVPTHGRGLGDRHPSLTVKDGRVGLVVHCFAGCDPRDVLTAIDKLDLTHEAPALLPSKPKSTTPADALALWHAALPLPRTHAAAYLASRALPHPLPSLRFLPKAPFSKTTTFPALVAGIQAVSREIIGVQLTFLDRYRARKAPVDRPRRVVGNALGGALRLAPAARHIGLAEGYETGHAAMLIKQRPVWCSLGAERLPLMKLPTEIEEVTIYADPDPAGLKAAEGFRDRNPHLRVNFDPPDGPDDYAALWQRLPAAERKHLVDALAKNLAVC